MLHAAFTLPELILAMSLTAIVGLAAAGVSVSLSYAHSQTDAMSDSIQSGRMGLMRIDASLRKAALVTAAGGGNLALWMGDDNDDGQINVDEIVTIQYLPGARTVESWRVAFSPALAEDLVAALNADKLLADVLTVDSVLNIQNFAAYAPYVEKTVLATDVSSFQVDCDADPPLTRRVTLRLKTGSGNQTLLLTDSAHLRRDVTGSVDTSGAAPFLDLSDRPNVGG